MVGPKYLTAPPQVQDDTWKLLLAALQKAQQDLSSGKTARQVITDLKAATISIIRQIKIDNPGKDNTATILEMKKTVISAIRSLKKGEDISQLISEVSKKTSPEVTTGNNQTQFVEPVNRIQTFAADYMQFVSGLVNPASLYSSTKGDEVQVPQGFEKLSKTFNNLVQTKGAKFVVDQITEFINTNVKDEAYRKFLLSAFKENGSESNFMKMMKELTMTQKAVDGFSIYFKSLVFDRSKLTKAEVEQFFGDFDLTDEEKNRLCGKSSNASMKQVIDKIFLKFKGSEFCKLALEANFGEGGKIIDNLNGWLGIWPQEGNKSGVVDKLKAFYLGISEEPEKLSKAWKKASNKFSGSAGRLLSEKENCPPGTVDSAPIQRDKFDFCTLTSFLYAVSDGGKLKNKVSFFTSATDKMVSDILVLAGDVGKFAAPTPVTATIFQNYGTIDRIYQDYGQNYNNFLSTVSLPINYVSMIYNSPFGVKIGGKSRSEAAFDLMDHARTLKIDLNLMEDMISKMLVNPMPVPQQENKIQFKTPADQIVVAPTYGDMMEFSRLFYSYLPLEIQMDPNRIVQYMQSEYDKYNFYLNVDSPNLVPSDVNPAYQMFSKLRSFPQSYMAALSKYFAELTKEGKDLTVQSVFGEGYFTNLSLPDAGSVTMTTNQGGYANANWWKDSQRTFRQASAQNLYKGSSGIANMFLEWYSEKADSVDKEKVTDQNMLAKLNALHKNDELVLHYVRNANDKALQFENIDAYVRIDGSWFRLSTLTKYLDDFNGFLKDNYGALSVDVGVGKMYGAIENISEGDRVAGVIGVGNVNFGLIYGQKGKGEDKDHVAGVSGKFGSTVVTAFYNYYSKDYAKTPENYQYNVPPVSGGFIDEFAANLENKWSMLGSVLTDHFYASMMGGQTYSQRQFIGGKYVNDSGLGVGALCYWGPGGADYVINGQYVHDSFVSNAFVYERKETKEVKGGVDLQFYVGGSKVIVKGLTNLSASSPVNSQVKEILGQVTDVINEINTLVADKDAWAKLSDEQQRDKLQEYKKRIDNLIFQQKVMNPFLPQDVQSQLSISVVNDTWSTSLYYSGTDLSSDSKKPSGYFTNITSTNLSKNTTMSLTLGTPVGPNSKEGYNFVGGKIKSGDLAVGVVAYFKDGITGFGTTLVYRFDDDWIAEFSANFFDGGNHHENFFIGNREIGSVELSNLKSGELSAQQLALMAYLGHSWYLGTVVGLTQLQEYRAVSFGAQVIKDVSQNFSLTANLQLSNVKVGEKERNPFEFKFGVKYNF